MKLVIVESPTKARTLSRYLGKGYQIEASMGHVRDLPKNKLAVDVEHDFKPDYVIVEGKQKVIENLKSQAKKASEIFLSMDPDREGEAIAFHVKHLLKGDGKFKRVVFHQITKSAIEQAFANPRTIDNNLLDAQQARRILDRLVGYTLSPLLWRKVRRGLSAGRVQSVAVRLIVEREREIEAFVPDEYWEIGADLVKAKDKNGDDVFTAWLMKIDDKKAKVTNEKQAKGIVADLNEAGYSVLKVSRKEAKKNPPPPFTTSTMQQMAANVLRMTAKRAMQVAQRLYESGYITYHRTDSVHLAPEAINKARKFIEKEYGKKYLPEKARVFKGKSKLAQEAHEAIRPTKVGKLDFDISSSGKRVSIGDLQRLYRMIRKRFLASQMSASVYDQTTVDIGAKDKEQRVKGRVYLLQAKGSIRKFDGWRKLYKRSSEDRELPEVSQGEVLDLVKVLSEQKFTEPPARFTDASLIKALEEWGIGRPSTYAPTISTILGRRYVEYEDRRFKPTPVGLATNDFLIPNFEKIFDYDFTDGMEEDLDKIAHGARKWVPVVRDFWKPFIKKADSVGKKAKRVEVPTESTGKKCPECKQGEQVIRVGKFGKFLSCSGFPECKYTANYIEKLKGVNCPEDGGDIVIRRTRKGRIFYGCANYPKCKWASWRKPVSPKKVKT